MGPRPVEVNEFFSIYLILPATLSPGVHSASNSKTVKKKMFLGSGVWPVHRADNLNAVCEQTV
jgi:hypothetical protein